MGVITKSGFPKSMAADLEVTFKETRERAASASYRQILDVIPTTSDSKKIVFYGDKGRLRRWRGERQPQSFNEYSMVATLDDWEMTETVNRSVLDDDQSGGLLKRRIGEFAGSIDKSLEKETWEFLRNSVNFKSFDKANFFAESHAYVDSRGATVGTYTYSNLNLAGIPVGITAIRLAAAHFAGLKSDTSNPLGGRLTDVVVARGSDNAIAAYEIANSTFTVEPNTSKGNNTVNPFRGQFNVIEVDYGVGASEFIALDLSDPASRPIVMLNHSVSPGFDNMEYTQLLEDSDTGFWRNEFAFGIFGRFDWNVGDPRTAYLFGVSAYSFTNTDLERQKPNDPNA